MRRFLQAIIIIASIILGLYVGIWVMFAGGIMQIINGFNPLNALDITIGILKIVFCEIAGLIPVVGITIAGLLEE